MLSRVTQIGLQRRTVQFSSAVVRRRFNSQVSKEEERAVGLAWDLETTGLSRTSEIVQLAVTVVGEEAGEGASSFSRFVMPKGAQT